MAVPEVPATFTKFPASLAGPFDDVEIAGADASTGRSSSSPSSAAAPTASPRPTRWAHVAGLTVGQDISDRHLQFAAGAQFSLGKSRRGYGPMGPWLVTLDELADPDDLGARLLRRRRDGAGRPHQRPHLHACRASSPSCPPCCRCCPATSSSPARPPASAPPGKPPRFLQPGQIARVVDRGHRHDPQRVPMTPRPRRPARAVQLDDTSAVAIAPTCSWSVPQQPPTTASPGSRSRQALVLGGQLGGVAAVELGRPRRARRGSASRRWPGRLRSARPSRRRPPASCRSGSGGRS